MAKKSNILKVWNEYEFKLIIPNVIDKNNRILVIFNFKNPATNKNQQIKKSTGIDRYALPPTYISQANDLINELIALLKQGWNPIDNTLPDYQKLSSNSTIFECIEQWLKKRESDFESGIIKKGEHNNTKIVFKYYSTYLKKNHLLYEKPSFFTKNDIDFFMRAIEKKRKISKPSYNAYFYKINFFYKFLITERVISFNPCSDAHRYSTKNLETRFKIYENDELENVRLKLKLQKKYTDLLIATHLLYTYRIRAAEQLRIQVNFFDFKKNTLTLPTSILEGNKEVNATKNGNKAVFQLSDGIIELICNYLGDNKKNKDFYLYSGHGKSGIKKMNGDFLAGRWRMFKKEYDLPQHLKFYALKHTSNYNAYANTSIEALSKINRHSDIKQTQDYINSKLKKEVISIKKENEF